MIVLASSSPRRQQLLRKITDDFIIAVPDIDEQAIHGKINEIAKKIALKKAQIIAIRHPNDVIIACDTIVVIDDMILGKPKDAEDAKRMLKLLSNRSHVVISGYAIIDDKRIINDQDMTKVYFNNLTDDTIDEYIRTGSPLDKAGAYGIQDKNFQIIDYIEGSYYNVMGFPLEKISLYIK